MVNPEQQQPSEETNDSAPEAKLSRRDVLKLGGGLFVYALLPHDLFGHSHDHPWSSLAQQAANRLRIYIAPDDHTDYFWTASNDAYRQAFIDMINYYLNLADSTQSNPPDFQSRWNCDGSLWMWEYERNTSAAQFNRFIERIRSGHISVPLNALVVCLGGAPAEAVLRGMYYAGKIERRHNLRFPMAIAMENQTLSYGLGSLWAGAGARYSWKGVCGCDSTVRDLGQRDHEIYWWRGPDDSRILMKWYSVRNNQNLGGYAEARTPAEIVDTVSQAWYLEFYGYEVIGAFGKGWDDFQTMTDEFVTVARQKTNASRRVIVSNEVDFFQDFEASYGGQLPDVSVSYGNEWDLYCASLSEVSARIKRATERLRAAEAMATYAQLNNPNFMIGREVARDHAWMALGIYWEHNFGQYGVFHIHGQARLAWQRALADNLDTYVNTLHQDAAAALGAMIPNPGSNTRFFVFNPLNWERTDYADYPFSADGLVHVVDTSTGQEVPSQLVTVDGARYLRIHAASIPSVGYRVYEIRQGAGASFNQAATVNGGVIENDLYRITVAANGAITSLRDKTRSSREFARAINGRTINDLGTGSGSMSIENAGPVSVTLRVNSTGPLAHTTRITLFRNSDRIDIRNEITQNFGNTRTWAFGFALNNPQVWHEEVGAVMLARLEGQGGHYAQRNARYDWLTLNHFANMSGGDGVGVTLSNHDCYFMKLGNSQPNTLDTATPQIQVLAGGRVGGDGSAGIPDQGGDNYFLQRFALCIHAAYSAAGAMRFALEHQTPLATGSISNGNILPETTFSLLQNDNLNLLLWAIKPADDGPEEGIITRWWNLSPDAATLNISLNGLQITRARAVTHIETPIETIPASETALTAPFNRWQLRSFALNCRTMFDDISNPAATIITEQVLFDAMAREIAENPNIEQIEFAQFAIGSDAILVMVRTADGTIGDVRLLMEFSGAFVIIRIGEITLREPFNNPDFAPTIYRELPSAFVGALDRILGEFESIRSMTLRQSIIEFELVRAG